MSLQSTDPIADLLTRIRNASMVGKTEIRVPSSKLKKVVADQLKNKRLPSRCQSRGWQATRYPCYHYQQSLAKTQPSPS
jgi:hypothetical protein